MFIDLDVVEFQDMDIPFSNVIINVSLIRQVQRIDRGVQERFLEAREEHKVKHEENPQDFPQAPTSVVDLPSKGAMVVMIAPQFGTYYTVTPYEEVRKRLLALGHPVPDEAT